MNTNKHLNDEEIRSILIKLKSRFNTEVLIYKNLDWDKIEEKLLKNHSKLWSLYQMEKSGGEPNLVDYDNQSDEFIFFDCSKESPLERRSFCYDREALDTRKEHKPSNSAVDFAKEIGIEILTEEQYRYLQQLGNFDIKTSSWIKTPKEIRALGGALFADFRYNTVFIYHNGAQSYYASRGFRGCLKI